MNCPLLKSVATRYSQMPKIPKPKNTHTKTKQKTHHQTQTKPSKTPKHPLTWVKAGVWLWQTLKWRNWAHISKYDPQQNQQLTSVTINSLPLKLLPLFPRRFHCTGDRKSETKPLCPHARQQADCSERKGFLAVNCFPSPIQCNFSNFAAVSFINKFYSPNQDFGVH